MEVIVHYLNSYVGCTYASNSEKAEAMIISALIILLSLLSMLSMRQLPCGMYVGVKMQESLRQNVRYV